MDAPTFDPTHALSGRNQTLFNVIAQYADMDMLRALALTSRTIYETLQKCHFDHLTMVVLEAAILEEQRQVVYNGADPVPADTFELPLNDALATPTPGTATPDFHSFSAWSKRSELLNNYNHSLIIPDYARDLMARARSVEIVVYRPRLGTRISTFFTANAHHLKYGRHTVHDKCTSCIKPGVPPSVTTQYKLHLPCSPALHAQHCDTNDGHAYEDNGGCAFSKHRSHQYFEGDEAESRRLKFQTVPSKHWRSSKSFPYDDLPSLQLKFPYNAIDAGLENDDGRFYIAADADNTHFFRPRFRNLPLVEQQAPTTSLKIRTVDCVSFSAEDWTNAVPGCTILPVHTWIIREDASVPRPRRNSLLLLLHVFRHTDKDGIGPHFPRLTSLVLQHTHLDETNRCGIDDIDMPFHDNFTGHSDMSRFFLDGGLGHLPQLQHFGVIGTLLDYNQYAKVVFYNTHVSSLSISPGPQPTETYCPHAMDWIFNLCRILGWMEDSITLPPTTAPRPRRKYNFSFDFAKLYLESCCPHKTHRELVDVPINKDPSPFGQHLTTCSLIHDALTSLDWAHKNDSENTFKWVLSQTLSLESAHPLSINVKYRDVLAAVAIARLAQRTLTHLEMRCHYCSRANPGSTPFPGARPGDCTATQLPPFTNASLDIGDLPPAQGHSTQPDEEMYMRLRQLLDVPPHVVLRL